MIKLLKKDLIHVGSKSKNKEEILNEIAEMVSGISKNVTKKAIYSALLEREELSSTGLGSSLAIPHCSFDIIDDFYVGLITTKGVDFDSIDGEPVKLIFFSIGPKSEQNQHITTLTSISKIAINKELVENIKTSNNVDELFNLLNSDNNDNLVQTPIKENKTKPVIVSKKKGFFSKFFKS